MASSVVAQLLFLESQDASKPISLYINSPGGTVTDGLAIYDTIQVGGASGGDDLCIVCKVPRAHGVHGDGGVDGRAARDVRRQGPPLLAPQRAPDDPPAARRRVGMLCGRGCEWRLGPGKRHCDPRAGDPQDAQTAQRDHCKAHPAARRPHRASDGARLFHDRRRGCRVWPH